MTDLRILLELATDEVESPDLVRASLATARRRRTWRRGALTSAVAAVAVAGVLAVPRALDSSDPAREPASSPTPTPSPSPTEEGAVAPPIGESVIQPAWDPATAAELPSRPLGHVPDVLSPTEGTGSRPGDTTGVLALSRLHENGFAVFIGESGWWGYRRVSEVGDLWAAGLSRDGGRMALVGEGGLFWCVAGKSCPGWTRVEVPPGALDVDTRITWTQDDARLIVSSYATGYLVDLDSGETTELPYLGDYTPYGVAPDGMIASIGRTPGSVTEWDGSERLRSTLTGDLGGLNDPVLSDDAIAATRIDLSYAQPRSVNDGDGLVVLSRDGLRTLAFLPFTGESGQWVDGGEVRPVQWLDDVSLLVSVLVGDDVHLIAWDTRTGELTRVTRAPASNDLSLRELGRH